MSHPRITLDTPGCVLFLIDQSSSMSGIMPGGVSKAMGVADALNRLLSGLVARCVDGGTVRDFLHVGVLGYHSSVHNRLPLGRHAVGPVSRLPAGRPGVLVPGPADGYGRLVKRRPWPLQIWLEPASGGGTLMCRALREAADACREFTRRHPGSYPPIVVNLSDGEATDGDVGPPGSALTSVPALLFNLHLSTVPDDPLEYPGSLTGVGDPHARQLFDISSVLPEQMREAAARMRFPLEPQARGFAYNARLDSLARFLDIGLPGAILPARRRLAP